MSTQELVPRTKEMLRSIAPRYWIWFAITVSFTIIDQWTKAWILKKASAACGGCSGPWEGNARASNYREDVIPGLFQLVHAENPGAAFGMFADEGDTNARMIFFSLFTLVAIGVLFHMLWQLPRGDRFQTSAIGLITSGAIGNFIDRSSKWMEGIFPGGMNKQSVTDFLRFFSENETAVKIFGKIPQLGHQTTRNGPIDIVEWPSFNIADSAIVIGLGMFFFHYLFLEKDEEEVEDMSPEEPLDAVSQEAASPDEPSGEENDSGVA